MQENEKVMLLEKIREIEEKYNVQIPFAVLSGSRAYGCAAENSDYDVRFVFVQPVENYLSVKTPRDCIEIKDEEHVYDIEGWDIKKAISLAAKSNATLWDWLRSPEIIVNKDGFAEKLSGIAAPYLAKKALLYAEHGALVSCGRENTDGKLTVKRLLFAFRLIMQAKYVMIIDPCANLDPTAHSAKPKNFHLRVVRG